MPTPTPSVESIMAQAQAFIDKVEKDMASTTAAHHAELDELLQSLDSSHRDLISELARQEIQADMQAARAPSIRKARPPRAMV